MTRIAADCYAFGGRLLPLAEARVALAARFPCVAGTEEVALHGAADRVLATNILAPISVPRTATVAVDGYAVHFDDLHAKADTVLPVLGRAAAGHPLSVPIASGTAARVLTGAMMPDGPDTVLMQEDCVVEDGRVRIRPGIARGANLRLAGEDVRAGSVALRAGRRLQPPEVGLLAALGFSHILVRRRLRVALLSTGDEISEPGLALTAGRIHDSNRYMIAAFLAAAGATVTDLGILPDDPIVIAAALGEAAATHDLVVSSGGVSVGEEDHVRAAIERLGSLAFWRLGIKPGRPVALGELAGIPLLGLPGNPVAALVTALAIGRPLLALLGGEVWREPPRFTVASGFSHRKPPDRLEYLRVRLERGPAGEVAHLFPRAGAAMLSSLTESDALVELPPALVAVTPGDPVVCLPFAALYG